MRDSSLKAACTFAIVTAIVACGRHDASPPGATARATAGDTVPANARTIAADANPCGFIDSSDVVRLLGPVTAHPRRGHDVSNVEPTPDGRACVYTLARVEPGAQGAELVAMEPMMEDAAAEQSATEGAIALAARVLGAGHDKDASGSRADKAPVDSAWDATDWMPNEFVGRVGSLAVRVRLHTQGAPLSALPADSVERLAALVRDHVPDVPAAAPRERWNNGDGGDPCALLTRTEIESALGTLTVAPYRSNGDTPLADPHGDGCSFYARRHHVLTLKPDWSDGRTLFRMQAAATRAFSKPAGLKHEAADTLEGIWDEAAAGMDGTLYFLKADRMLTVVYRTAGVSEAAALRLASLAMERMR